MTFCETGGTLFSVVAATVTGPRTPAAAVPTGLPAQMHIVEFCDVEPLSPQHGSALARFRPQYRAGERGKEEGRSGGS